MQTADTELGASIHCSDRVEGPLGGCKSCGLISLFFRFDTRLTCRRWSQLESTLALIIRVSLPHHFLLAVGIKLDETPRWLGLSLTGSVQLNLSNWAATNWPIIVHVWPSIFTPGFARIVRQGVRPPTEQTAVDKRFRSNCDRSLATGNWISPWRPGRRGWPSRQRERYVDVSWYRGHREPQATRDGSRTGSRWPEARVVPAAVVRTSWA